jgi:hypothetical protein
MIEIGQEVIVTIGAFKGDVAFVARIDTDGTYALVIRRLRALVEGYRPEEFQALEP